VRVGGGGASKASVSRGGATGGMVIHPHRVVDRGMTTPLPGFAPTTTSGDLLLGLPIRGIDPAALEIDPTSWRLSGRGNLSRHVAVLCCLASGHEVRLQCAILRRGRRLVRHGRRSKPAQNFRALFLRTLRTISLEPTQWIHNLGPWIHTGLDHPTPPPAPGLRPTGAPTGHDIQRRSMCSAGTGAPSPLPECDWSGIPRVMAHARIFPSSAVWQHCRVVAKERRGVGHPRHSCCSSPRMCGDCVWSAHALHLVSCPL
jgi:hypothetical protein